MATFVNSHEANAASIRKYGAGAASLKDLAMSVRPEAAVIRERCRLIQEELLASSRDLRTVNFEAVHPKDLAFLFRKYDEYFFAGLCGTALQGRPLGLQLSQRLTRAGGKTIRFLGRNGEEKFEILIAIDMLFDGFRDGDRSVNACGIPCENRLEGLQRIFEHEIVHLIELLCWGESNCSAARFQDIAARHFLHQAHTHALITRRERAAQWGITAGSRVAFEFEGRRFTGRVNRVTKRASVLVEDPGGMKYSDGRTYKKFYVPLGRLERAE